MPETKLSIGAVTIRKKGAAFGHGLMGSERVRFLSRFYRGEDIGDLEVVAYAPHHPLDGQHLKPEDVDWQTSGIPAITEEP